MTVMDVDICRDDHKGLSKNTRRNLSAAKMRWKLLAKALQEGRVNQSSSCPGSVRQFSSFQLVNMMSIDDTNYNNQKGRWYQCSCFEEPRLKLRIRVLSDKITCEDLRGFDNTGNVCIWPSEEVLTYYCMKNKELFGGKSVCELGAGMTGLSGLSIAATAGAKEVFVTDGNIRAVQNIQLIVDRNLEYFGATLVVGKLLRWDVDEDLSDSRARFDVVICADCLYFDEGRESLSNTIWKILKDNGVAVILAPIRGRTFQQFVDIARRKFYIERLMVYDIHVWDLHYRFKGTSTYNEDLHYPQMLVLRKI